MAKYCPEKDGSALYLDCKECDQKICNYFFCLVVGSRSFQNYDFLKAKLNHLLQNQGDEIVIVSGGAKGADNLAERYAREYGLPLKVFPADWEKHGRKAGFLRNEEMHKYIAKQSKRGVVAFWDGESKGTAHNFELGKKYKNHIKTILFEEEK